MIPNLSYRIYLCLSRKILGKIGQFFFNSTYIRAIENSHEAGFKLRVVELARENNIDKKLVRDWQKNKRELTEICHNFRI